MTKEGRREGRRILKRLMVAYLPYSKQEKLKKMDDNQKSRYAFSDKYY